jgi:hypothetical protein
VTVQSTAFVSDLILVTVTAVDAGGNTVSAYTGAVQLGTTDQRAFISAKTPLVNGQQTVGVVFRHAGQQTVTATDASQATITGQANVTVSDKVNHHCEWIPIRPNCNSTIDEINGYFSTSGPVSFLNQVKSIYNGASSSATVSADIASLNFMNGMQVTAGTNIQAGSSSSPSSSSSPASSTGTLPILSAAGSAQAAQNMLYGGTIVASALYPLLGFGVDKTNNPGSLVITLNLIAREGVDIQSFKAGTSMQVSSPPSHTSGQMEAYLAYNAINPPTNSGAGTSGGFAGSVFVGGAYGYSYTSHGYAVNYGIPHVSNGLGQVSAGILVNGVVKIAVSRGFGPAQTYIDSTTNATTTVNNFKAWSIGISYQSPAPAATK